MSEYCIQYYKSKYIPAILTIVWAISVALLAILIINNKLSTIVVYIILMVLLFIIIEIYRLKICSRSINVKIYDNYIEINKNEKILFSNIIEIRFMTIKNIRNGIITGYIIKLKYNINEKIKIVVLTGTSKKEKINCEYLIGFYNELRLKYKNIIEE
jgi:hypothetical protein